MASLFAPVKAAHVVSPMRALLSAPCAFSAMSGRPMGVVDGARLLAGMPDDLRQRRP